MDTSFLPASNVQLLGFRGLGAPDGLANNLVGVGAFLYLDLYGQIFTSMFRSAPRP